MKKKVSIYFVKMMLSFVMVGAAVYFLDEGIAKINRAQQEEHLLQLENSLKKAVLTCYANEGVYPPTIQYLKENYGIQIDEERYEVFYEIQGSNLMPNIAVMESEE